MPPRRSKTPVVTILPKVKDPARGLHETLHELFYDSKTYPTYERLVELSGLDSSTKVDPNVVRTWYEEQPINQIHKKPPIKSKLFNHYQISTPYERFETDILFLPEDRGNKYALTMIDCASRFKWAQPLKNKTAAGVVQAYKKMEQSPQYKDPQYIVTDDGSEFKGDFKKYITDKGITITTSRKGVHPVFVERFNGTLAVQIFKYQQQIELDTGKTNRAWISVLQDIVEQMNNTKTRLINMKPIEAIKLDEVPQPENKYNKTDANMKHEIGTVVRYLLNPDEIQDTADAGIRIERRRRTDPTYSVGLYKVAGTNKRCEKCLVYHQLEPLDGAIDPGRSFTYWQLGIVPKLSKASPKD